MSSPTRRRTAPIPIPGGPSPYHRHRTTSGTSGAGSSSLHRASSSSHRSSSSSSSSSTAPPRRSLGATRRAQAAAAASSAGASGSTGGSSGAQQIPIKTYRPPIKVIRDGPQIPIASSLPDRLVKLTGEHFNRNPRPPAPMEAVDFSGGSSYVDDRGRPMKKGPDYAKIVYPDDPNFVPPHILAQQHNKYPEQYARSYNKRRKPPSWL